MIEEFAVRVFAGGKVTVPKQLRERFGVSKWDYVRSGLVEVWMKSDSGDWVKRRVQ